MVYYRISNRNDSTEGRAQGMTTLQPTNKTAAALTDARAFLFAEFMDYIDREEATARTYANNLRQFFAYLAYTGTATPTRQTVKDYREYLRAEHDAIRLDRTQPAGWTYRTDKDGQRVRLTCKPATVRQYLQSVRQFYDWATANGYAEANIAANIHAPKIRQDIHKKDALTAAEVADIEESIITTAIEKATAAAANDKDTAGRVNRAIEQGRRLKALYLLAVTAGLRTIELSRANVEDLIERGGRAYIYIHGKGDTEAAQRKPLAWPVYKEIRAYLNTRHDAKGSAPLFTATGNRSGGQRLAATTISTMLKQALAAAGYRSDKLTAHSLRHTAGTTAQAVSGNLYLTQQYMRHKNPKTTEIYLHNDTEQAEADIAEKIYKMYHDAGQGKDNAPEK